MRYIILILLVTSLSVVDLSAEKYAGEIFQMGAGIRNFALGNCGITDSNSNGLAYWNSALLIEDQVTRFELQHAEEYMGLLTYDTFSAIWGNKHKLAAVLTRIGIDDIPLTKLQDPEEPLSYSNRPYEYKNVNNSDLVLYLGLARMIGKYTIGFTPKFAYRNLAEESGFGFGLDVSTYFRLRDDTMLGIKIRDVVTTQILWANGTHEIVNPSLDMEINRTFDLPFLKKRSTFYLRVELFTENREEAAVLSLKPLSLDPHLGLEIDLHKNFEFLLGYDVRNLTSGFSLNYRKWQINYAFELDTELDNSHRVSIGYSL